MVTTQRWTSADLEAMQHDDKRYEIIDGELFVSTQPSWDHQELGLRLGAALLDWNDRTGAGRVKLAPGVIFSEDSDVAPDVVWVSTARQAGALDHAGHLHAAPELMVEVLSPGATNERRDREAKLKLYSRRGVSEYWIADPHRQTLEIYRRREAALHLVATLHAEDTLESPLLPGFSAGVRRLFGKSA